MVLAGIILKMGILFCRLFCSNVILILIGVFVAVIIILNSDGKVVIAYSSVAHITLCVAALGFVSFIVGLTHVIISPLIFMAIYVRYNISGSRVIGPSFST
jgi:NADH:ubiquinone oxidoreductase subunit 5 (subunit L)/multisubunit Na+/H+ antiporter MnhA subunit